MKKLALHPGLLSLVAIILFSCNGNPDKLRESPTTGNIKITCDESFELIVNAEINTFQSLYPNAKVNPTYKPEGEVILDFLNDSIRTIIITRKLTKDEEQVLMRTQDIAKTTKFIHDGICFISSKENADSNLRYEQIQDIFTGKLTKWSQINPKSTLGDIIVVFDNARSSNFSYVQDTFMKGGKPPAYCFAVKSNPEVLAYVKNKKNAIGVIGLNWVSDKDDTISHRFLSDIRVMAVGAPGDTQGIGEFKKPYQGYIADGSYPLNRDVYVICRESFAGLGSGFASFVAGDVGQRIILKSGLVPATMPLRLVHVKKDF